MDFRDTPEQAAFRDEVRAWLDENLPDELRGHRGGEARFDGPEILRWSRALHDGGMRLGGVMAHAGSSYGLKGAAAFAEMAEQERSGAVAAAEALRGAGLPCPEVSVGSTPTAHFARDLTGVTEVRAGVFMFFDLVMAGIGACSLDDIAISVLASVVGHQRDKGWILIDAGWMAMSRDRGTARSSRREAPGTPWTPTSSDGRQPMPGMRTPSLL